MASDIRAVVYTDDEGNQYECGISAAVFAQMNTGATAPLVGGADYAGTPQLPPMPRNLRPRQARVANGAAKRSVICLTPTSDLFTGAETSINLTNGAGVSAAYTRYSRTGEKYRFRRSPTG